MTKMGSSSRTPISSGRGNINLREHWESLEVSTVGEKLSISNAGKRCLFSALIVWTKNGNKSRLVGFSQALESSNA